MSDPHHWKPSVRWRLWARIGGTLVAFAVLAKAFSQVDMGAAAKLAGGLGPALALVPLPYLVVLANDALGFRIIFIRLGHTLRYAPLLRVRVAGEALAQSLPLGVVWCESVTAVLLRRHAGLSAPESVPGMAARRYGLMLSQGIFLALLLVAGFGTLSAMSRHLFHSPLLLVIVALASLTVGSLAAGMAVALRTRGVAGKVGSVLRRSPGKRLQAFFASRQAAFGRTDERMRAFFDLPFRSRLAPAACYLLGWLLEGIETFVLLRLLHVHVDLITAASIEALVVFVRHVLIVLPAGLGVQDIGYMVFLGAAGVPHAGELGAAFVLLKRGKELLWVATGYALVLLERDHPFQSARRLRTGNA